jgi:hypothetical protein
MLAGHWDRVARRVFARAVQPDELAGDDEMSERGHQQSAHDRPEHNRFRHYPEQSSDLRELQHAQRRLPGPGHGLGERARSRQREFRPNHRDHVHNDLLIDPV